ncbi:MAG: peptidoglycan DD-metalloendopeptidase family protein, partial [Planctomycetia bacterium]|nr:peptidoglycan DD-metalloendopeptidase family protein [Planctomycetia bacterium]
MKTKWNNIMQYASVLLCLASITLLGTFLCNEAGAGEPGESAPNAASNASYSLPKPVAQNETVVELNIGETQKVKLSDGSSVNLKLISINERKDSVIGAIRLVDVMVEINGHPLALTSGDYSLPVEVKGRPRITRRGGLIPPDGGQKAGSIPGVKIDCPSTYGYVTTSMPYPNGLINYWGMKKAARFRLWPKDSPLTVPGTFVYPVKQKFLASASQMCNEPVFVGGSEAPGTTSFYYHYGLDFAGSEGDVDIVAMADGLIVSAADHTLPEFDKEPIVTHIDGIWLLDGRGWYYRYSHLNKIFVKPGQNVKAGQVIAKLGKEGPAGYSGGWSHLHLGILTDQCTGLWGDLQAYPYVFEAYWNEYKPKLLAVARPHHTGVVGEKFILSGANSKAASGKIVSYEWMCSNGKKLSGKEIEIVYDKPGAWSEILKVTDSQGNVAYDAVLSVIFTPEMVKNPPKRAIASVPRIHLAYYPTFDIKPGTEVTFKVRSSWTDGWNETLDFGDGSPIAHLKSDGNRDRTNPTGYAIVKHKYAKPGTYI